MTASFISLIKDKAVQKDFLMRHIAYLNIVRLQLRKAFALLTEMSKFSDHGIWLVIPFSVLISWVFMSMEQISESSENPFDNGTSDTPMSTICRNIEINILEMLDEPNIPPKIEPFNNNLFWAKQCFVFRICSQKA